MMVFSEMGTITFHTFSSLNMTYSCHMPPLPTVLTLQYTWIHICIPNCYNVATNVESLVNDFLSIRSVLSIPNVYPNDGHVGLGRYLDDTRFWCEDNVVEQVIIFQDIFDFIQWNMVACLFTNEQNTNNLEVWLQLQKSRWEDLVCVRRQWVFNIFFNLLKI